MFKIKASKEAIDLLTFSPDGQQLAATGNYGHITVWDVSKRELVWEKPENDDGYSKLAFTPDGRYLVGRSPQESIVFWSAQDGTPFKAKGKHTKPSLSASQSLVDLRQAIMVYDAKTESGKEYSVLPKNYAGMDCSHVLDPEGRLLAVFLENGQLSLFDWQAQREVGRLGQPAPDDRVGGKRDVDFFICDAAFQPRGRLLVTSSYVTLRAWDLETATEVASHKSKGKHIQALTFTPDGRHLITGDNDKKVKVWDSQTLTEQSSYDWKIGKVYVVTVSRDGLIAAAAGTNGTIVVWDLAE